MKPSLPWKTYQPLTSPTKFIFVRLDSREQIPEVQSFCTAVVSACLGAQVQSLKGIWVKFGEFG